MIHRLGQGCQTFYGARNGHFFAGYFRLKSFPITLSHYVISGRLQPNISTYWG